jgi:methylmalonyl-CoA mutase, N-terminal domain
MTINATAAILLAMYIAVARSRACPATKLEGTIQNDILKEYIARGTYIFPPRRRCADHRHLRVLHGARCRAGTRSRSPATTSARPARTAVQEVAFTLADAIAYVEAARPRASTSTTSRRGSLLLRRTTDLLEEVAKFRAARRLWARIMRERFGAKDAKSRCCASTRRRAASR